MSNGDGLEQFGKRIGVALRDSAGQVDGTTRSRLAQARATALEQPVARPWRPMRQLVPAGALAAAALVALLLVRMDQDLPRSVSLAAPAALDDLELLGDADALDLAGEPDLDFIEWAAGMAELEAAGG